MTFHDRVTQWRYPRILRFRLREYSAGNVTRRDGVSMHREFFYSSHTRNLLLAIELTVRSTA